MNKTLTLALSLTMLFTSLSQAAVIEYNGFSYDTEQNYVSDPGSMQWLQWTETANTSLDDIAADDALRSQGWQVASREQILGLFNNWFGRDRLFKLFPTADELFAQQQFISFFGSTTPERGDGFGGIMVLSQAMFGGAQGQARMAEVWIDGDFINFEIDSGFNQPSDYKSQSLGIVLVRSAQAVPAPASLLLCSFGLGMLLFRRKR